MPASPSFRPSPLEATFPDTDLVQSTTTSILSLLSSPPSVLLASQDGDWLETAGTYTLNWLKDVNYGAVFASSLFPYLWFLKNIWADDYPIPKVRREGGREGGRDGGREGERKGRMVWRKDRTLCCSP